jgi:hypothetical protein
MLKSLNQTIPINEKERVTVLIQDGTAVCRLCSLLDGEWQLVGHTASIDIDELVELSNALSVLGEQRGKAADDEEWNRRLNETSALFNQNYRSVQENIIAACAEISRNEVKSIDGQYREGVS